MSNNPSFIGVYDNTLSLTTCKRLIKIFDDHPSHAEGKVSINGELRVHEHKQAIEIADTRFDIPSTINTLIQTPLNNCLTKYVEEYSNFKEYIADFGFYCYYNFQKYETENDGFKAWHTEHGINDDSHRILVWSIYLNESAGTEFLFFPTLEAKPGRCAIWPASFTHIHRSEPNRGLKYLLTGWIELNY